MIAPGGTVVHSHLYLHLLLLEAYTLDRFRRMDTGVCRFHP